jgi:hypothetical protein
MLDAARLTLRAFRELLQVWLRVWHAALQVKLIAGSWAEGLGNGRRKFVRPWGHESSARPGADNAGIRRCGRAGHGMLSGSPASNQSRLALR